MYFWTSGQGRGGNIRKDYQTAESYINFFCPACLSPSIVAIQALSDNSTGKPLPSCFVRYSPERRIASQIISTWLSEGRKIRYNKGTRIVRLRAKCCSFCIPFANERTSFDPLFSRYFRRYNVKVDAIFPARNRHPLLRADTIHKEDSWVSIHCTSAGIIILANGPMPWDATLLWRIWRILLIFLPWYAKHPSSPNTSGSFTCRMADTRWKASMRRFTQMGQGGISDVKLFRDRLGVAVPAGSPGEKMITESEGASES